jgi:AcrR family transcriptional regulator
MAPPDMREKILETASQLFAAEGYEAVSMRRVASEVGVTQANLYHYFKNKEDLILSSLAHVFSGKAQDYDTLISDTRDPMQCLERGIEWFFSVLFEAAVFANLYFREMLVGDENRLKFLTENVFQEPFSFLVRLIDETMDTEDSVLSALFLTSTIAGYFQSTGIIPHLREGRAQYLDPKIFTRHLMGLIRKSARPPYRGQEASA